MSSDRASRGGKRSGLPPMSEDKVEDQAQTKLIEIAARVVDHRTGNDHRDPWLREFRAVYRHLAATVGERLEQDDNATALEQTEKGLGTK